jgi:hypothetical protein
MPRDPAPAAANTAANRSRALLLLPLAALLAILPLLIHGCSCGHDLVFHVQSWLDAAQQLRHGHYPRWAFSPAWNAGEPRFIFYPPLSWLLGALLTMIFPTASAPQIYIFLALTAAGFSMYNLASRITVGGQIPPHAALLAAAFYLANPYMLFNAFERSALAELLAAAWIPLLLLAVLRPRPTIRGVAIPVALLWLTNAPAAVMGCYTLALLAALRVLSTLLAPISRSPTHRNPEPSNARTLPVAESNDPYDISQRTPLDTLQPEALSPLRLALTYILGAALGLALPAFYLIPAAFERRYVQVAMAVIPNLRFQDNFLFTRTPYEPHNVVTHTISVLAIALLLLTVAVLSAVLLLRDHRSAPPPLPMRPPVQPTTRVPASVTTQVSVPKTQQVPGPVTTRVPQPALSEVERVSLLRPGSTHPQALAATLAILTLILTFLLVPLSTPIWQHLPELAFLQFPWRLLTILAAVLCLGIALLLDAPSQPGAPFMTRPHRGMGGVAISDPPTRLGAPLMTQPPPRLGGAAISDPPTRLGAPLVTQPHRGMGGVAISDPPTRLGAPFMTRPHRGMGGVATPLAALLCPVLLAFLCFHLYGQACAPDDRPSAVATLFRTHHGAAPTDEYTPTNADNDTLRSDDPGYWLASDPQAFAPHTIPNPNATNPDYDKPTPIDQTVSARAPMHLTLHIDKPEFLILNLRDYSDWNLTEIDPNSIALDHPAHIQRDDGLIAVPLYYASNYTIDISWRHTPDQELGDALSLCALLALALTFRRSALLNQDGEAKVRGK